MTNDDTRCKSCRSPVELQERELPRRIGATHAETTTVRVCTNPNCDTNNPRRRRVGQTP